jgi:hypothetical protein
MTEANSFLVILQEQKSQIFKPEIRHDRVRFDALMHPDFFEFGRGRSDILELLPLDKSDNKVWAQDWSVRHWEKHSRF